MKRRLRTQLAALGVGCLLLAVGTGTSPTAASWSNSEYGKRTFTAGTVNPPTNLQCSVSGVASKSVTFTWTLPTGGATRTGFSYLLDAPPVGTDQSGTLAATATSRTFSPGLITLGTSTFTLRAVGPTGSGWTSTAVTGSISATTSILVSCTPP